MLNDNRDILDRLALELLEKETLDHIELAEIFEDVKKLPPAPAVAVEQAARVGPAARRSCRSRRSTPSSVDGGVDSDSAVEAEASAAPQGARCRDRVKRCPRRSDACPRTAVSIDARASRRRSPRSSYAIGEDPDSPGPAATRPAGSRTRTPSSSPASASTRSTHLGATWPRTGAQIGEVVMLRDIRVPVDLRAPPASLPRCRPHRVPSRRAGSSVSGARPGRRDARRAPPGAGAPERADRRCAARGLDTRGVLVVLDAAHDCVTTRGVRQARSSTVTIAARGSLPSRPRGRNSWHLIGRGRCLGRQSSWDTQCHTGLVQRRWAVHASGADAVAHGVALVADGADFVDVGGESTRPGRRAAGSCWRSEPGDAGHPRARRRGACRSASTP